MGKRDYAIFSLMTTYGLRACDVVALTLDDIKWRAEHILVRQSKTGNPLELPLTDEVGSTIQDYLRKLPRYGLHRQVLTLLRQNLHHFAQAGPVSMRPGMPSTEL